MSSLSYHAANLLAKIRRRFEALRPEMDERMRRQLADAEAKELGWGGISLVASAMGLSRPTISVGISASIQQFHRRGSPAMSVDTKKKELVGDFENNGREWRPRGTPEDVRVYDFQDKLLGKAIPYCVYDNVNNQGWVNVGVDHDAAQFAANSIQRWWARMGQQRPV